MKRIVILGSTGSIGTQTVDVVRQHPEELEIVGLAVNTRVQEMLEQARAHKVKNLAVGDERLAQAPLVSEVREQAAGGLCGYGMDAVVDLVRLPEADVVVNALVGAAGLRASFETLRAGKVLALANKESLVVGGDLIMPLAARVDEQRRAAGVAPKVGPAGALMPIDSEHGAIYQCLLGESEKEVSRLWVTASGGPFRGKTRADLEGITPAQALKHPTWNMGAKISIDSSTLMNKGLEVIEAHHLFNMPYEKINVVVQPQSAIHSMVEFTDGSVKAHLGTTDMRIPIQFALSYPKRWAAPVEPLDFTKLGTLEFAPADTETFRCLALARHAGSVGGTLPCVMNAANEVAVASFLAEEGTYLGIAECVEAVMNAHEQRGVQNVESLEQLIELDAWARDCARANVVSR
ncbi:MAG: 1-deoxy-D-xylulose-5-phosphate reductoisomerase [Eggerthellaceae bacterium]|nr:1-deoxy-D-xylulose-5-phosphate reductoisomerase [Eggerthellaceae bacterium]